MKIILKNYLFDIILVDFFLMHLLARDVHIIKKG